MDESNDVYKLAKTAYVEYVQTALGYSCTFEELSPEQRKVLVDVVGHAFIKGRDSVVGDLSRNAMQRLGCAS